MARDAADPLAHLRARFRLPAGTVYLDGNSLGALPADAPARLADAVGKEWGEDLIRSWEGNGWRDAPARVAARIAPLIGAAADEVAVADSTSVNLFKLAVAACRMRPDRRVIVTEPGNFPTDLYLLRSVAELVGAELRLAPPEGLGAAVRDDVALLALTHVDYRSARRHDLAAVTTLAHDAGAVMLWDLSHSTGAIAVDVSGAGVDLAVGCGYKYLNGGPGAPAYAFVARRHHERLAQPLTGWFGHAEPFAFAPTYAPAPGAGQLRCGTPPVLSLLALECGVRTFDGVDLAAVERKGRELTGQFIQLVDGRLRGRGFEVATPRDPAARGSHVALVHPGAPRLMAALAERRVIGDLRPPSLLRFGFAPLYVRHVDVFDAVEALAHVTAAPA